MGGEKIRFCLLILRGLHEFDLNNQRCLCPPNASREKIHGRQLQPRISSQTRGFSNGKKARESKLPTTSDILQTRPFSPRNKDVSTPKDTRSFSEKMEGAEFRYNGVSLPTQTPSTELPGVQREEVSEENSQEQSEGETSAANISVFAPSIPPPENPILSPFSLLQTDGLGEQETGKREDISVGEEEKEGAVVGIQKQQLQTSPDEGTIQRQCDECGAEKEEEEEKLPETIQAQAEISSEEDYTQNTFSSIRGDEETEIWQPKSIGKLDTKESVAGATNPIIQRKVEKRVGTSRGVGTAGIGTLTCASIANLKMAVFWELLSTTGDPFSAVDVTYTFSRGHQPVRYSSAIVPPSKHFERREEFQFNEPGTVAVLLRGATPASTPFLRRVIGPIEANCELRQYPSGGSGPARSPGRPPENSDHDISYTKKKHTRDGSEVRRDLKRGREAHIFNDNIDLSALEQKVWVKGFYAGEFRRYHRWVYISPTQIGLRIQNERDNVPLYVVEIKGEYRGDRLVYHLDPRARASEDKSEDT